MVLELPGLSRAALTRGLSCGCSWMGAGVITKPSSLICLVPWQGRPQQRGLLRHLWLCSLVSPCGASSTQLPGSEASYRNLCCHIPLIQAVTKAHPFPRRRDTDFLMVKSVKESADMLSNHYIWCERITHCPKQDILESESRCFSNMNQDCPC